MIVPDFVGVPIVTRNLHHSNLPCWEDPAMAPIDGYVRGNYSNQGCR